MEVEGEETTTAEVILADAVDEAQETAETAAETADAALSIAGDALDAAFTAQATAETTPVETEEVVHEESTTPDLAERLAALEALVGSHEERLNVRVVDSDDSESSGDGTGEGSVVESEGPEVVEIETGAAPEADKPDETTKTETETKSETKKEGSKNGGGKGNGGRRFRRGR